MDRNWTRLGEQLRAARLASGIQQNDMADRVGLKRGALRNIELGKIQRVTPAIRTYAQAVGWTAESVDRVLAGGDPTVEAVPTDVRSPEPPNPSVPAQDVDSKDLSVAVRTALREGPLLDSQVIRVRTAAGEVTATIVARGEDGMSAGAQLEALRAWQSMGPVIADGDSDDANSA